MCMKKVCHVSSAHPQEDIRIFWKECISLSNSGYEVFLVTQGDDQEKNGVRFIGLGSKPQKRLQRILFFTRKAYKKALEIDADLYHFHDPELLPYALKMAKRGKKVIFDSHEFTASQISNGARKYIPGPLQTIVGKMYQNYERKVTRKIDGVIIPCLQKGKDYFDGNYKRIAYVNNTPKLGDYAYIPDERRDENTTCYVGSITVERGIINTIKASYKAGCKLKLIGNIDPELLKSLKTMPEYEAVDYHGMLSVKEFPKVICNCTVGLCLLKNLGQYDEGDNLSTKIYEYMAMGIPMVVSNFRMNKLVVEGNECGICVDPENIDDIARAIKKICLDKKLAEKFSYNGRLLAVEKYSWEVDERNLLQLYDSILRN